MNVANISVTHQPLTDITTLSALWYDLEQNSDNRFFLSSAWISSWLEAFSPLASVVYAKVESKVVGLGIFTVTKQRRHGFIAPRTLRLHQTGIESEDQIWIEYNDFLLLKGNEQIISKAMQSYLTQQFDGWDEWSTGAMDEHSTLHTLAKQFYPKEVWRSRHYGKDLALLRSENQTYRQTLSKNTRYQISRTEKAYKQRGEIRLEVANTMAQSLSFFEEIAPLHQARWASLQSSGFDNPNFVRFHQLLIEKAWESSQVELVRLLVDDKPVGYLYNFLYKRRVYFYLSAFVYEDDQKIKPGLLMHCLCIEKYTSQDMDYYDFMGGDMRYKRSLADTDGDMVMYSCQKPTPSLLVERAARRLKNFVVKR